MEEKKRNNRIILAIIGIIMILGIIGGITYAYFSAQASTETQTVTTAKLDIGFTNGDIIRAVDIEPIDDDEIKTKATELPFTVTNNGNKDMKADIKLTNIEIAEELKNVNFRWGLFNEDTGLAVSRGTFTYIEESPYIIRDVVIDAKETKNYILRVWIHNNGLLQNEMQEKTFSAKVEVTAQILEYTDESCFTLSGGYIVEYSDSCPKDVVIPKTINGVTVEGIISNQNYVGAFQGKGLTSVVIPDNVNLYVSSNESIFADNNLSYITIPEGASGLCHFAFNNNQLSQIFMPDTITTLGDSAVQNNKLKSLVIPVIDYSGISQFANNELTEVVISEGIEVLSGYSSGEIKESILKDNKLKEVEIPSSITKIETSVFYNNPNLTKVIVRGKTSLSEFADATGLSELNNAEIIFAP